jgi:hypothetical protein
MAAIRGDLSVLSIANLVQALVLDRCTGILTLEAGTDRRILRLSPEKIRLIRGSQRCHRLERLLRKLGRFTEPAEGFTLRGGMPSRRAIGHLVRDWMLEEICELFTWSRGTFVFQKALPGEQVEEGPFAAFAADCDITTIALEAACWADDVVRIKSAIRDLRLVPVLGDSPVSRETAAADPEALEDVLHLIDGTRPVIQILQRSVFPRFVVLKTLYRLLLDKAIVLMAPGSTPAGLASPLSAAA